VNISTAISGFGKFLQGTATAITPAVQAALPVFAPIIAQALAPRQRITPYYGGGEMNVATGFMPGGPMLPAIAGAGLGLGALAANTGLMTADPYGGLRSPVGSSQCITPTARAGYLTLPRTVHVPNPNNPSVIETYVKAPRVKYRVSVSRAGGHRRCSGGR
jgi:hypothetical protein